MTDLTVDLAALAGFELDLTDMGANFISNSSRFLPGTALPGGATGLMAALKPSFEKFQTAVSTAQRTDSTTIETFRASGADGGQPSVVVDYKCYVFDRYNWDSSGPSPKGVELLGFDISDKRMGGLHTAEYAQEFNMFGTSSVQHYGGLYPPMAPSIFRTRRTAGRAIAPTRPDNSRSPTSFRVALRSLFVGLLVLVSLVGVGCSESVDRAVAEGDTESGTGPELIREATEYGGWTLPANGKVLLAQKEAGREPRFRLTVEMTPPDLEWMLQNSGYSTPFGPGHALSISTIAGPDPNSSPKLLYARDNITSPVGEPRLP